MSWWTNFIWTVQKDEKWVVAEFQKGWQLLRSIGHTAEVDIANIHTWLVNHHAGILAVFKGALTAVADVGVLIPVTAPFVPAATAAIDLATKEIDILTTQLKAGPTPLSTALNAYQTVKHAENAVNDALKAIAAHNKP